MSTLAHIFESAGMATIVLGSIKEQVEGTSPPRALYCDFPLGRPLGEPLNPEFQHRVLEHAFKLLDAKAPIIEDYDISITDNGSEILACPLPPRHDPELHPAVDEARGLRPAYERSIAKYGNRIGMTRTVELANLEEALLSLIKVAEGAPWKEAGIPGVPSRVSQDIRGYYETAVLELSESAPKAWTGARWFFKNTEAGKIILSARKAIADSGANQPIWFYMTPGDS